MYCLVSVEPKFQAALSKTALQFPTPAAVSFDSTSSILSHPSSFSHSTVDVLEYEVLALYTIVYRACMILA